jgi:hypothetical protein
MSDQRRIDELSRKVDMLCELVARAHGYAESDPKTALAKARESAEAMCLQIFADRIGQPDKPKLEWLIQRLAAEKLLPERVLNPLRTIQQYGNYGAHAQLDWVHVGPDYVATSLHALATVTNWYFDEYLCEQVPAEIRDLRVGTERIAGQDSRRGFAKPLAARVAPKSTAGRLRWPWLLALALLTLVLIVGGLLAARALWYPRFVSLTFDDTGADGPVLRLEGEHLANLSNYWGEDWVARLEAAGLGVAPSCSVTVAPNGRSATLRVTPNPDFDAVELPLPQMLLSASPKTARLRYHFKMRVHVVRYDDERYQKTVTMFQLLLDHFRESEKLTSRRVTFDPEVEFSNRPARVYQATSEHFTAPEIEQTDLIDTSTFLGLGFKAHWSEKNHRARGPTEEEQASPFVWVASNVGTDDDIYYASVLIAAEDSRPAQDSPPGEGATPEWLDDYARLLPEGQTLTFVYGAKGSTSGYVIPALTWDDVVEHNPRIQREFSGDHRQTIERVLAGSDRGPVVGVVYEPMLRQRIAEPDFVDLPPRILWRRDWIPHGGILLRTGMIRRKRDSYEIAFAEFFDRIELEGLKIVWPRFGDVSGLSRCDPARYDEFEKFLLKQPAARRVLPELYLRSPTNSSESSEGR